MTTSRKARASTSNIPYDPEDHTESFGEPHSLRSRRASTSKLVSYKEELAEEEPHASEDSDASSSLKHRPTMPKRVTRIRVNSISRTPSKPGPKARRKKNSMLPLPKTLDLKEPSNVCAFCLGPVKVIYHDKKNRVTTYGDGAMGCPKCFTSAHVDCEGFMTEETYAETQKYEWVCQNCKTCEICNTNQGKKGEAFICDYCDRQWDEDCLREKYNQIPNADPDILWKCPKCNPDHPSSSTAQTPMDLNGSKRKRVSFNVPSNASGEPPNKKQKTSSLGKEDQLLEAAMQQVVNQPKISLKFKPRPRTSLLTFDQTPKRSGIPPSTPSHRATSSSSKKKNARENETDEPTSRKRVIRIMLPASRKEQKEESDEDEDGRPFGKIVGEGKILTEEEAALVCPINDDSDTKAFLQATENAKNKAAVALARMQGPQPVPTPLDRSKSTLTLSHAVGTPRNHSVDRDSSPDVPRRREHHPRAAQPPALRTHSEPVIPTVPSVPAGANGSTITKIRWIGYEIQTWHFAPYPKEYITPVDNTLYICEYCLGYLKNETIWKRHRYKCPKRQPPGTEIYVDGPVSVFEVDGQKNKIYCQNLCLLAKMFLDHKTLYYDVEPFLFYVMTLQMKEGCEFVGYFSKEKRSPTNNVSCIMTLPIHQGGGYGQALIDFSYLLTKTEQRTGTPERPLTGLGLVSYRNYWTFAVFRYLASLPSTDHVTIEQISKGTAMMPEDIFWILQVHDMITNLDADPINSSATPAKMNPTMLQKIRRKRQLTIPQQYRIEVDVDKVTAFLRAREEKARTTINPESLRWTPFLVSGYYGVEEQRSDSPEAEDDLDLLLLEEDGGHTYSDATPKGKEKSKKRKRQPLSRRKPAPAKSTLRSSLLPVVEPPSPTLGQSSKPGTVIHSEEEEDVQSRPSHSKRKRLHLSSEDEVDMEPFPAIAPHHGTVPIDLSNRRAESTSNSQSNGASRATSNDEVSTMLVMPAPSPENENENANAALPSPADSKEDPFPLPPLLCQSPGTALQGVPLASQPKHEGDKLESAHTSIGHGSGEVGVGA